MIIAIDGPAGAGKSTVCRLLAKELGYTYLDTGAMYRAIAWALIQNGSKLRDDSKLSTDLSTLPLVFSIEERALCIYYKGRKLDEELRPPEIAGEASRISRIPEVRTFLTQWQRRLAEGGKVIAEGRDMTTVVFPDAPVKVFLTAHPSMRAQRRYAEYLSKGIKVDYSVLEAQMRDRDAADRNRSLAPLRAAEDAIIVDTSTLEIPEVVDSLLRLISQKT